MKAEEAYALSRKYTENTVAGAGAVAGKPCQIQSITDITGGHRITFLWKDNSNVDHTSVMDVMNGKGIKAVAVNSSNHLIITYDDDTTVDAGKIDIHSAVNSVNGKTGNVNLTASDVGALPDDTYEEEIHGVNLLKNIGTSQTVNGITFTVNADGSVTANGTATAFAGFTIARHSDKDSFNYEGYIGKALILSGCPANGSISSYKLRYDRVVSDYFDDYGEGLLIVPNANYANSWFIEIAISSGVTVNNLVFRPMLRLATIEDSTYRPYNYQAIQNQLNSVYENGAVNHLDNKATNRTISGITFTVGDNKIIYANGTSANSGDTPQIAMPVSLPKGRWAYSGCPDGGSDQKWDMILWDNTASLRLVEGSLFNSNDRLEFEITDANVNHSIDAYIRVRKGGVVCNNIAFKPMIAPASYTGHYVPFAMTNRELTEKITKASKMVYIPTGADLNNYYQVGEYAVENAATARSLINKPNDLSQAFQLRVVVRGYRDSGSGSAELNVTQIIECINDSPGIIYMRTKSYGTTWSSWYKFTGTVVS